jgi:hypothetical protein
MQECDGAIELCLRGGTARSGKSDGAELFGLVGVVVILCVRIGRRTRGDQARDCHGSNAQKNPWRHAWQFTCKITLF